MSRALSRAASPCLGPSAQGVSRPVATLLRSTGRGGALRAAAIRLFLEALGIEGVRGRGNGGQGGESDERGKDRLHGDTPKCWFPKSVGEQHA
jgi:hypothetical protein